jgi:hypothetical protein
MRRFALFLPALLAMALAMLPSLATATSQVYVSIPVLTSQSSAVVLARIGDASTSVDARTHRPRTTTTVQVREVLWGEAPAQVQVIQTRGTVNGQEMRIPGDPALVRGQDVVLFVRKVDGRWYLTALDQSLFELVQNGKATFLRRQLSAGYFEVLPGGKMREVQEKEPPVRTLAALRRLLGTIPAPVVKGGAQ